jgi:ADP-ribosylglycohydrolase
MLSLLGGAVGDALGARVEFMSLRRSGTGTGWTESKDLDRPYGRVGAITDEGRCSSIHLFDLPRLYAAGLGRAAG